MSTPATTAAAPAGASSISDAQQAALNVVANTPYLKSIDLSGKLSHKGGKFSLAATATRSATIVTRTLMGSSVAGDCCAFVYAQFNLTGTLTFKAADGITVVGTKDIDMTAYGNYELVKDAATGDWVIVKNAVDGLIFSQGYAPYIQETMTSLFGPYMPGDTFNVMATVWPANYGNELHVSGQSITAGVNVELLDDGVSPDTMASDYTYTGAITVPSTAAAGDEFVFVMDVMDTTASFDLTQNADSSYVYPYSGSLFVHQDELGTADTFTSASVSCADTEVPSDGATHCVVLGMLSDGTTKEVDADDVLWSISSGYSYVSEGGIVIPYMEGALTVSAQVKEGPNAGTAVLTVVAPTTTFTGTEVSAPTGVTATAGDGQITVSWDAATDALGYNVYVATESGVTAANYSTLSGGTARLGVYPPVVIDGLANGTPYYVVVTSLGVYGESAASTGVSATPQAGIASAPSAPLNVTATATAYGEVTLTWNPVAGATYYNIYMAAETGVTKTNYATLSGGMIHAGATSPFVHTALNTGFTYYFVVTAGNELGESAESVEASVTIAGTGASGAI